jgi:hypothetical protein
MSFSTSALLIRPPDLLPQAALFQACGISAAAPPAISTVRCHFRAERGIAAIARFPLATAVFCYGRLNALSGGEPDEPLAKTLAAHSKGGEIAYAGRQGVVGAYALMLWRGGALVRGLSGTSLSPKPHMLAGKEQQFELAALDDLIRNFGGAIGDWRAIRDGEARELGDNLHKHSDFGEVCVWECFRAMTGYSPGDSAVHGQTPHPFWDTPVSVYKAAPSPAAPIPE